MGAFKIGDWERARKILGGCSTRLKHAISASLHKEAQGLRKEVVDGMGKQAPGQSAKPLAATTIAARQIKGAAGTRPLVRTGELRRSVTAVVQGDEAFVGVLDKAGKARVAQVQEYGAGPFVVAMTTKMRRFLHAVLRRAGVESSSTQTSKGVVVIRIPPRPFLRPAFEEFRKGVGKRFLERIAQRLGLRV